MKPSTRTQRRQRVRRTTVSAAVVIFAASVATLAACNSHPANSATNAQTHQNNLSGVISSEFTNAVQYPFANCGTNNQCTPNPPSNPLELQNLAKRLVQYNSKGDTNYVYLLNYMGGAVGYYVINGKVSSTGSQMTSTDMNVTCNGNVSCTNLAPGDDGSYGPEEGGQNGVFFFTTTGTLVETNDPFWIESSAPIPTYVNVPQLQK